MHAIKFYFLVSTVAKQISFLLIQAQKSNFVLMTCTWRYPGESHLSLILNT